MVDERHLVLDANILIRAVLGHRVRQIIETHALHASFFAPEVAYADAGKYLEGVVRKRGGDDEAVAAAFVVLDGLRLNVLPVQLEVYESHRVDALSRIELRDPDDWPILATALTLECPIWTEDQDFFGAGVPTWTTDRVEIYLKPSD